MLRNVLAKRGFTLLEIAFALMLISGALVVVVGLQTSSISRAVADRNIQKASLIARSVLSAIELNPKDVPEQDKTESADKVLSSLIRTRNINKEEREEQRQFMVQLRVEPIELAIPPDTLLALKRFDITVFAEDAPEDSFNVVYIARNK